MRLVSVSCNHCGAPLEVPDKTRYVTCAYCSARLEIHRTGSAVYSEVLERIGQQTEKIADDVETIKLQNEIERLDRQWMMAREDFKTRTKDGHYRVPSTAGSLIGAVVVVVFGIFWTGMTLTMGAPLFFSLFGVLFVVMAIVMTVVNLSKATAYQQNQGDYQRRRQELMRQLQERR